MRSSFLKKIMLTSLLMILLSPLTVVTAKQTSEDKIKFRQSAYMTMRWNMGIIKQNVIKHPEKFNRKKVLAAARVIAAIADSGLDTLFTPNTQTGTGWKKTRVKPDYFENRNKVEEHTLKLVAETRTLVETAKTGDAGEIKTQFKQVLGTCKGCHKEFRLKD